MFWYSWRPCGDWSSQIASTRLAEPIESAFPAIFDPKTKIGGSTLGKRSQKAASWDCPGLGRLIQAFGWKVPTALLPWAGRLTSPIEQLWAILRRDSNRGGQKSRGHENSRSTSECIRPDGSTKSILHTYLWIVGNPVGGSFSKNGCRLLQIWQVDTFDLLRMLFFQKSRRALNSPIRFCWCWWTL